MPADAAEATVVATVRTAACRVVYPSWTYADENRTAIARHWAQISADNRALFNGGHYIMTEGVVDGDRFDAWFAETDYAAFMYARAQGALGTAGRNCFGSAAIHGSDGSLVLGRMADWTANAGKIYLPGGSLGPEDHVGGGVIDLAGSIAREMAEETGLSIGEAVSLGDLHVIDDGPRLSIARPIVFDLDGQRLAGRIRAFLAKEDDPELADIVVLRPGDRLDPKVVPPYTRAYAAHAFASPQI